MKDANEVRLRPVGRAAAADASCTNDFALDFWEEELSLADIEILRHHNSIILDHMSVSFPV